MSTGDQTQYVRSKIAERGSTTGASFMTDGFDKWAESNAPARAGQMEKTPAETQMVNYGGAMSLNKAKKLHMSIMGGASVNVAGIQIEVPQFVEDGIKIAKEMIGVVEWAISFYDEFQEDLFDNVIDKPADYAPQIIEDCKELLTILEGLRPWRDSIKYILDIGKSLGGIFGSGKKGKRLVGGDWAATFEQARATVEGLIGWYNFFKQKAATIRVVLSLQSVKKVGGDKLLELLNPIFGAVGMGRRGKCCCDDSGSDSERMGGAILDSDVYGISRKVGGKKGNLTKLKQLLVKAPAIPKLKMGGQLKMSYEAPMRVGGPPPPPSGGMSAMEKMQYLSPKEQAQLESRQPSRPPGRRGGMSMSGLQSPMMGGPPRPPSGGRSCGGKKPSARGEIVKKVMREQGMSLPQASKYVKEQGLY